MVSEQIINKTEFWYFNDSSRIQADFRNSIKEFPWRFYEMFQRNLNVLILKIRSVLNLQIV